MNLKARIERLTRTLDGGTESGPLTVFLCEADAEHPPGRRILWNGAAREIIYDPTAGRPMLPPGTHKLILNAPPGMADGI